MERKISEYSFPTKIDDSIVEDIIIQRRGDVAEMIALTLGGALILFTCMALTLWMIGLVLLCCLCLCAITCHPSKMIPHQ